jgi:hypothetical protein
MARLTMTNALASSATLLVALASGCVSNDPYGAPAQSPRDRVINDPAIDTVTLLEFSDQVGESIVNQISSIPEIAGSPSKVVLILGRIENKTAGTSIDDFQIAQRRLRAKLVNSDIVRRKADLVERPEVVQGDYDALAPRKDRDPFGDRRDDRGPARYDPEMTYILTGYFGEMTRGGGGSRGGAIRSTYFSEFSLTHLGSSRTVFTDTKDSAQGRR